MKSYYSADIAHWQTVSNQIKSGLSIRKANESNEMEREKNGKVRKVMESNEN